MEDTEDLRSHALTLSGKREDLAPWLAGREVLHQEAFGNIMVATIYNSLTPEDRVAMERANIDVSGCSCKNSLFTCRKKHWPPLAKRHPPRR